MSLDSATINLTTDAVTLTEALVNLESVSRNERAIADAIETALSPLAHLELTHAGHAPTQPYPPPRHLVGEQNERPSPTRSRQHSARWRTSN